MNTRGAPAVLGAVALLIADRDNDRLIIVNPSHQIVWRFPTPGSFAPARFSPGPTTRSSRPTAGASPRTRSFRTRSRWSHSPASHGYNSPGRIDVITPSGRIVWTYAPQSGAGELDQPSLAVELPNGLIAATDDYNQRVVVIDPRREQIVWQYGHRGRPGIAPGYPPKPDGLDLLP